MDNRIYYEGGYNRFEIGDIGSNDSSQSGGIAKGQYRELRLNMGDILLFRGEICEHSLTPVTNGYAKYYKLSCAEQKLVCIDRYYDAGSKKYVASHIIR